MKLRILTAVVVLGAVMSGQAFAEDDTFRPFTYELCDQSPRELAASSRSDREFSFVTAMCKRHDSNYGKSDSEKTNFTFDNSDCPITFGRANSIFTSSGELRALEKFCDQLKVESAKSANKDRAEKTEDVRDDAWYEKHSRYIRWTVIRNRSEGMPEECRYFFCDMQGGIVTKIEASNFWIITLPRNKGAPEDCKRGYCQKVYTESATRPAVNEMYRGTGLAR